MSPASIDQLPAGQFVCDGHSGMQRRTFLTLLAAGALTAVGTVAPFGLGSRAQAATSTALPHPVYRTPRVISHLPGTGQSFAWTVDDGIDSSVVAAYVRFATQTGLRMTFSVNGVHPSWTDNAPALRPLVDSGQVQLINHTWSHPDLTTLSSAMIVNQVKQNELFLYNTFGINPRPYFRPPYGARNTYTDKVLAYLGYPNNVLWNGTLGDSALLCPAQIMTAARASFVPLGITLAHANYPAVTTVLPQLQQLIIASALQPVTLRDAFGS